MKPRLVRCYRGFASLPGKANIEVFYTVPDFGYSNKLFTCIECGELFIIDFENPNFAGKTAEQIAAMPQPPTPTIGQVTAMWDHVVKRVSRRRRILETILAAARPLSPALR